MKILILIKIYMLATLSGLVANEVPRLHDEYDPQKWPRAELKLSQAATLKDVFDSGLRPYRFPGMENTALEVKHIALDIKLGSGKQLPSIDTEMMRIKPFRDGEIGTIEGFTPKLTLKQARVEILKWLPYGENKRTLQEIDKYLLAVKADYLDFDDPYRGIPHGCGVSWNEPGFKTLGGGPRCGFGFRKTASQTHPLRLHFGFRWGLNRPSKDRGSYRPHPIKPPPGYEDVDMTAPEKFGPDSAVEILRSKGIDIGETSERTERRTPEEDFLTSPHIKEKSRHPAKEDKVQPSKEKSSYLPWVLTLALLTGILALLFKIFRDKPKSYFFSRNMAS